jgi:hypothetical protein
MDKCVYMWAANRVGGIPWLEYCGTTENETLFPCNRFLFNFIFMLLYLCIFCCFISYCPVWVTIGCLENLFRFDVFVFVIGLCSILADEIMFHRMLIIHFDHPYFICNMNCLFVMSLINCVFHLLIVSFTFW